MNKERWYRIYEIVYQDMLQNYSQLESKIIDWYPNGDHTIILKLDDGRKFVYYIGGVLVCVYDPKNETNEAVDESEWRRLFSYRLRHYLCLSGIPQYEFARLLGITEAMLSRYLNAKATPSSYIISKMAKILGCPISYLATTYISDEKE